MDPVHKYLSTNQLNQIEEYVFQQEAQLEAIVKRLKRATIVMEKAYGTGQVVVCLTATVLASFAAPAPPLAAPTDGPESTFGTRERFVGGPGKSGAYRVTHPTVRACLR